MTKNTRLVYLALIGALILAFIILIGWDLILRRHATFNCGDGPRRTIDIRDFTTQYSGYSVEFEADIAEKGKISAKVNPVQLQQLSEATQNAMELRKYVVAGYNSCAITKVQYGQYGSKFQTLDDLAREMNEIASKPSLSQEEARRLSDLIKQYGELVKGLGAD